MTATVFCLDFDETLMNTDRLRADLVEAIRRLGKEELVTAYQEAYESTRERHGVPRIPLVVKTMADRYGLDFMMHFQLAELFHNFPYQNYMYPGAEQVIAHLKEHGSVLILSDGDGLFQPHKIRATSVADMVDEVIVIPQKTDCFDDIAGYWPAEAYVFIDDKQKVLDAAKAYFGDRATTILVRQGRYANVSEPSAADISIDSIAEAARLKI